MTTLAAQALCRIGLGTGDLGTKCRGDDAVRLIDRYRELGGNVLDTAHIYGAWVPGHEGASERDVGEWLRYSGDRSNVFISTKGGHPPESFYAHAADFLSMAALEQDLTESKERLGTDTIDLYYLHRDDGVTPVPEIIDRLNALPGIRYLGASNWSVARLATANQYAQDAGKKGFSALQNQWSLAVPNWPETADPCMRRITPECEAWCLANDIWIQPYSSTANGYFARLGEGGSFAGNGELKKRVLQLAAETGTTPTQIALTWLLDRSPRILPLVGTTDPTHVEEAIEAMNLTIKHEDLHEEFDQPRAHVMAQYQESLSRFGPLYDRLAK